MGKIRTERKRLHSRAPKMDGSKPGDVDDDALPFPGALPLLLPPPPPPLSVLEPPTASASVRTRWRYRNTSMAGICLVKRRFLSVCVRGGGLLLVDHTPRRTHHVGVIRSKVKFRFKSLLR